MKKLISLIVVFAIPLFSQSLEKSFRIKNKYINIPIDHTQERQRVHFKVDGKVTTFNDIRVLTRFINPINLSEKTCYIKRISDLKFISQQGEVGPMIPTGWSITKVSTTFSTSIILMK